jgi:ribosomal protein S18 acetylase RimI-like enzyme
METVRRIRIGEGRLFKQIRLASLRESPSAFETTYESALRRSPESWSNQSDGTAEGSDRATFIAFSNDSPIGIAALYRKGETDTGESLQVWISPEHRNRGVANDLLDAVFHWAGENCFRAVLATVVRDNTRALRFYQNYGFKPLNVTSLDNSDAPVVLAKDLTARIR